MSKEELSFVDGEYKWYGSKMRVYDRTRCVIVIKKGGEMIGLLCWHKVAKQIVYSAKTAITEPLIRFITPMMNKGSFYTLIKYDRYRKATQTERE